jgi:hypothetical protein
VTEETVYVVMMADRHADPEPEVFTDRDAAVAYARKFAEDSGREVEEHDPPPGGWLYYATYSPESDSVWVVAKTLRS